MKNYIYIFSFLLLSLFSCSTGNSIVEPQNDNNTIISPIVDTTFNDIGKKDSINQGEANEPEMALELVKFKDNKYREYILAEYITQSVTMRGDVPPLAEELIVGTIPYSIELPNGYWAIDWRWGLSFIYPPSNILLPYTWSSLKHWNDTWEKPHEYIKFNEYIEEIRFVDRRSIDEYSSIYITDEREAYQHYSIPYIYWKYTSISEIAEEDKKLYYNEVYRQDSLHSAYIEHLIDIINKGAFDSVSRIGFDNFYKEEK